MCPCPDAQIVAELPIVGVVSAFEFARFDRKGRNFILTIAGLGESF